MDDRQNGDGDNRLELDRIRDALEQGDIDAGETLPTAGHKGDHERALPELPREDSPDRFLVGFGEGSRAAPVEEAALEPSEGLAKEQQRALHTGGSDKKGDGRTAFGAGKPLPQGHEQVPAPNAVPGPLPSPPSSA